MNKENICEYCSLSNPTPNDCEKCLGIFDTQTLDGKSREEYKKTLEITNLTLVTNRILVNQKVIMDTLNELILDVSLPFTPSTSTESLQAGIKEAKECTDIILKKIQDDYESNQNQKES